MPSLSTGIRILVATGAIIGAVLLSWPAWAAAEEESECAEISANGTYKQMNLRASEILVNCEVLPAGSATGEGEEPLFGPGAFPGSDINVITGSESYPHVTQSESFVWSHGSTIVVAYNDSRGSGEFPPNYSGASVSTNGGESFSRLGTSSPFTGHGANYGDPIVVYNEKLEKWFAGFLAAGCGGQGIGLWTSTNGKEWSVGSCAHSGTNDDRESMWVDNNPSSPYYGRMYISYNDFAASGALKVTYSDNGTSWSSPVTLFSGFRRNVQLAGSNGSEGVVFLVALDENGGGAGNTGQRNYMYRSMNGGTSWTSATMGSTFTMAGSSGCGGGYFPVIPPIWRQTGYGQPAVGPGGVLQYVYAAHGEGSDEADIFYVRSTNNGETWSTPLRLNTDKSGKAQWMPSLRVTSSGVVEASWYDRRSTTNGENYQRFARVSVDNGATWGEDEPLSTVLIPQPTQPDPNVQACYAGDYNYTTATANTGLDTWTDGRVSVEGKPVQKVFFHGIALQATPSVVTKAATEVKAHAATLNGTVNPNGSETTYQFEYGTTTEYGSKAPASPKSIGSGTTPVEVSEKIEGLKAETTYHFRLVATNAKGTTNGEDQTFTTTAWEIVSTPNPSGATDSELYDVSCEPSTNVCTSVGKSTVSGADVPLAQRWNGTSWSEQTPAKKSGSTHNRLFGVDCPSETRCIAVGDYQNSEGGPATLGELWNESKWGVQTTPVPSEATSSELVAVGCNNTAECKAVGSAEVKGVKTAIAEKWASPTWSLQTVPIPEGAKSSQLDGVDCLFSNLCVAVGRYTTSGGSIKSLAMFWNGTSWSQQTLTEPEGAVQSTLLDVSCTPTPNRCTAVGGWKNSAGEQFTLAYRFNGVTTWTLQSTPNPSGSIASVFQDVSCASETSCTAAGSWVESASNQTLAEKWNGTSWSIQGTPNPAGAGFSAFFGVSCRSTTCMGVGYSTDGSGVDTTLAEIRK